jgi:hypothetical protein
VKVTFTKKRNRYDVDVSRDRATDLFIRSAPGYDDWLPHDVLHFVAEAEYGLDGGVFGHVASGGNARIFISVDPKETTKIWRQARIKKVRLPDGRRSEELAGQLERGWRRRTLEPVLLAKLDALAEQWHALPIGGELTLEWPRAERGRRAARRASAAASVRRAARSGGRSRPAAGRGGRARPS